ncbi:MAG: ribosomal RNA small subunit methyltransferase A [Spirochaetaceae bacterium]|nr:ribosomal RNA small subunit methyltransferase A [Spirochaetaceae bacterium]
MRWNFAYDSPHAISDLLQREGLAMTKKFGQNFLLSRPVRERIVSLLEPLENTTVWEVGPGIGSLTALLLERGAVVTAFEIDHGFCRILREHAFGEDPAFHLVEGDALKTLPATFYQNAAPERICGNLPYNVGSVVIAKILEEGYRIPQMVFTLQKEVVDRLCASPGSKLWSSFSLLAQMDYEVTQSFVINAGAFFPTPNVTSSVVHFTLREESLVKDELRASFLLVIRDLFAQRRKTVRNNLLAGKIGALLGKEGVVSMLEDSSVEPSLRAEALSWSQFLALSETLSSYQAR